MDKSESGLKIFSCFLMVGKFFAVITGYGVDPILIAKQSVDNGLMDFMSCSANNFFHDQES